MKRFESYFGEQNCLGEHDFSEELTELLFSISLNSADLLMTWRRIKPENFESTLSLQMVEL